MDFMVEYCLTHSTSLAADCEDSNMVWFSTSPPVKRMIPSVDIILSNSSGKSG